MILAATALEEIRAGTLVAAIAITGPAAALLHFISIRRPQCGAITANGVHKASFQAVPTRLRASLRLSRCVTLAAFTSEAE